MTSMTQTLLNRRALRWAAPPLLCVGLALGNATPAFALPVDDYKHCKASRGKGSGYECCLNIGGSPIMNGPTFLACEINNTGTKKAPS
jgi:hypothetical protein